MCHVSAFFLTDFVVATAHTVCSPSPRHVDRWTEFVYIPMSRRRSLQPAAHNKEETCLRNLPFAWHSVCRKQFDGQVPYGTYLCQISDDPSDASGTGSPPRTARVFVAGKLDPLERHVAAAQKVTYCVRRGRTTRPENPNLRSFIHAHYSWGLFLGTSVANLHRYSVAEQSPCVYNCWHSREL